MPPDISMPNIAPKLLLCVVFRFFFFLGYERPCSFNNENQILLSSGKSPLSPTQLVFNVYLFDNRSGAAVEMGMFSGISVANAAMYDPGS